MQYFAYFVVCAVICVMLGRNLQAQDKELYLIDWKPVSQMIGKKTKILKPKFPVIDIHKQLDDLKEMENYLVEMC